MQSFAAKIIFRQVLLSMQVSCSVISMNKTISHTNWLKWQCTAADDQLNFASDHERRFEESFHLKLVLRFKRVGISLLSI